MEIFQIAGPMITAGIGSVVATRVSVARLQADAKVLFKKVDELAKELHLATLEQEREHGEVKAHLATLDERINGIKR